MEPGLQQLLSLGVGGVGCSLGSAIGWTLGQLPHRELRPFCGFLDRGGSGNVQGVLAVTSRVGAQFRRRYFRHFRVGLGPVSLRLSLDGVLSRRHQDSRMNANRPIGWRRVSSRTDEGSRK